MAARPRASENEARGASTETEFEYPRYPLRADRGAALGRSIGATAEKAVPFLSARERSAPRSFPRGSLARSVSPLPSRSRRELIRGSLTEERPFRHVAPRGPRSS